MKEIGLLTLVSREYNYGGLLQQYALYTVLQRYGAVEIINYDSSSERGTFSLKRGFSNFEFKKIKWYFKYKRTLPPTRDERTENSIKIRKNRIDQFRKDYLEYSDRVDVDNIEAFSRKYSYIFCGSDQIWNPEFNVPSFFLSFSPKEKNIIYSASVGKQRLTNHQRKVYEKYIDNLEYVSVREREVLALFSPHISAKLKVTLDPTLLVSSEEWMKIKSEIQWADYIFCYFLGHTEEKISAVKAFAKKNNKKVIAIPYLHRKSENDTEKYADILLSDIGPQEFLGLIFSARCVITDSFHACIFSLIFNKCFYVFGRYSGLDSMDNRIETLLSYFDNASERLISPSTLINKEITEEKYQTTVLENKRKDSIRFIENSMNLGG